MNIGFVGFSDESKYDEVLARRVVDTIFDQFACNEKFVNKTINIITGGTNQGIPRLVYEKAALENQKFGPYYHLVGIMAKEGYLCTLYPCDEIHAIGEHFGDESEFFIDSIDCLYKIGGGKQSEKEYEMAKQKGIPCTEIPAKYIIR